MTFLSPPPPPSLPLRPLHPNQILWKKHWPYVSAVFNGLGSSSLIFRDMMFGLGEGGCLAFCDPGVGVNKSFKFTLCHLWTTPQKEIINYKL